MTILHLDIETFSEVPIKHGTHAYSEGAEIMLCAYAWGDEPVAVLDLTDGAKLSDIQALIDQADEIVVHNSAFDRTVLRHNGVNIPVEKIHDTMVQALSHSLPGSLGLLCDILSVPVDKAKDKQGKSHIQLFCKPLSANRKLRRATSETHPEEWLRFKAYAGLDIDAMREVRKRLPKWNFAGPSEPKPEWELWLLDQRINDRGFAVDVDLATAALRAADRAKGVLAKRMTQITDGAAENATQRNRIIAYLAEAHGFVVEDLKGGSIDRMLDAADLTPEVREVLENRQEGAATSPAKYRALLNGVSEDGRLRGAIQFCGASRTGRDAGRVFQPQNLPRPTLKTAEIEAGILAMKANCEDLVVDNVMELCTSAIRGCIVAPPGKKLLVADLSNIEGRVLAWLAGEEWKLKAFRDFDAGIGPDLYKVTAGGILKKPPEEVTGDERQVHGKVPELACGFGGALGAFKTMGALYGVDLPESTIMEIVKAYRTTNARIAALWREVESACRRAVESTDTVHRAGRLAVQRTGAWMRMRLPVGRYLCYASPVCDDMGKLSYLGINQYTRKFERLRTYGGKLVENPTQGAARDVLMAWVRRAEDAGYCVVLRVHDELICEVPDTDDFTVEGLLALLPVDEPWLEGLPLAAAGFACYRYGKH